MTRLDRLALGARREGERHAVLEDRLGQRDDVVERGREAAVEQRAGADRQHQRLAGARARAPGDAAVELRALARAGGADEVEDRLDDGLADRQAADQALGVEEVLDAHRLARAAPPRRRS